MDQVQAAHLARFLTIVGQTDDPDAVCRYVTTTALSRVSTLGAALFTAHGDDGLTLIGSHGIPATIVDGYRYVSLHVPIALTEAFRTDRDLLVRYADEEVAFPSVPGPHYEAMHRHWGPWQAACLQLRRAGAPFGSLVVLFPDFAWQPANWLILDGLASAVSLWLQGNGYPRRDVDLRPRLDASVMLTERQTRILMLVHEGATNREIAERLHISVSLVKQEVSRAEHLLGSTDRAVAARRAVVLGLLMPAT